MRTIRSLVASGLLLSLGLTGCGSSSSSAPAQPAAQTPAAAAKPVEIEFWYGLGGKLGKEMEARIAKFNETQTGVHVTGVAQGNYTETVQKLQAAMAAGQVPAAALLSDSGMRSLLKAKAFQSLDSYMADPTFKKDDIAPAFRDVINGSMYSIPLYGTTQVLYYRKDLFEKAGIDPNTALNTWEDLAAAARKLHQGDVYGWEPMWGADNLTDAVFSRGGKILSDDGKKVLIGDKVWVDTYDQFRKWIHDEKIMAIHSGGQGWEYWYKTIDDVMKGQAAGYTGSSGDQGDLDFTKIAAHVQPGWKDHPTASPVASAQQGVIPAGAAKEQKDAAWKWFTYLTSADVQAGWSISTGYVPVRLSALDAPALKEYATTHPQIAVPPTQLKTAQPGFVDPTGGKILDALSKAADKVEIQNVPAADALKVAAEQAQAALDAVSK